MQNYPACKELNLQSQLQQTILSNFFFFFFFFFFSLLFSSKVSLNILCESSVKQQLQSRRFTWNVNEKIACCLQQILLGALRVKCTSPILDLFKWPHFIQWCLTLSTIQTKDRCKQCETSYQDLRSLPVLLCHYTVLHFVFDFCLYCIPFWDNGFIQIQRWKSPIRKVREERVNYLMLLYCINQPPADFLCISILNKKVIVMWIIFQGFKDILTSNSTDNKLMIYRYLTLNMLGKIFSRRHLGIVFLFFSENIGYFKPNTKAFFLGKNKTNIPKWNLPNLK